MFQIITCALIIGSSWAWTITDPAQTIVSSEAWADGKLVQYYNLGNNTNYSFDDPTAPSDNPVWILIRGFQPNSTKPILIDGQLPLFGSLPGQSGYSDIHRVSWVLVDPGYVVDSWRSLEDILGNVSITQTPQVFANMALVPNGTTLQGPAPFPIRQGYYRQKKISFVSAGTTLPIVPPAYLFYKPGAKTPSGKPVISVTPDHLNYTGFWDVQAVSVPADYVDGTIKTAADAVKLPHQSTGQIVNWPVVLLADANMNTTTNAPAPGDPTRPAPATTQKTGPGQPGPAPAPASSAPVTLAIVGQVVAVLVTLVLL